MEPNKNRKGPAIKAAVLIIFLVTAIVIVRFTPLREYLSAERLGLLLETAGHWVPVAYIGAYAAGVCLFMPGTLLATVGAAIFGPYFGFLYVWLGAMLGASLAFLIGRYLGRDFAASLIGDRLEKYDEAIERNGFATVLYLRLVYFPFTPMNFAWDSLECASWIISPGRRSELSSERSYSHSLWGRSKMSGQAAIGRGCLGTAQR